MRRFVCTECGKTIEVNWCTKQRGRDMKCPDCGSRMYRDHIGGQKQSGTGAGVQVEHNAFVYGSGQGLGPGKGCRTRGRGKSCGRPVQGRGLQKRCRRAV